jgi:hypothetical protein
MLLFLPVLLRKVKSSVELEVLRGTSDLAKKLEVGIE